MSVAFHKLFPIIYSQRQSKSASHVFCRASSLISWLACIRDFHVAVPQSKRNPVLNELLDHRIYFCRFSMIPFSVWRNIVGNKPQAFPNNLARLPLSRLVWNIDPIDSPSRWVNYTSRNTITSMLLCFIVICICVSLRITVPSPRYPPPLVEYTGG